MVPCIKRARTIVALLSLSAWSLPGHAVAQDLSAAILAVPDQEWEETFGDGLRKRVGLAGRCEELETLAKKDSPRAKTLLAGAIVSRKCATYDLERALVLARQASFAGDRRGLIVEASVLLNKGDIATAFRIASLAEIANNPQMQKVRADILWRGLGQPIDKSTAMRLYQSAATKNEPSSLSMLGWITQEGQWGSADPVLAETYHRRAVATGWIEALVEYGNAMAFDKLGAGRRAEGIAMLERAKTQGSLLAINALVAARSYDSKPASGTQAEIALLQTQASQGSREAAASLGALYRGTSLVGRDRAKAVAYLKQAADAGHAESWRLLHYEYMSPEAAYLERAMAMIAIEKASQLGDDLALNEIGVAYELGVLVPKSNQTALYFYQRAAGKGVPSGHYNLGRMHHYGLSAARDLKVAEKEYALAVAGGWTNAVAPLQQVRRELAAQTAPRPATPRLAVAAPAAPKAAAGKSAAGAPTAKQIQDALVYENAFGRVTAADAMGLIKRSADYANGISRAVTMGITAETVFRVANARCSAAGKGRYACAYDLSMKTLGVPWSGRGSHTFAREGGTWRSPTYLAAIIKAGNQSAANQKEPCVLTGFGTLQGPHLETKSGGYCTN